MSANPALVQLPNKELIPAPFQGERFILSRRGVEFEIDGVNTRRGKWSERGIVYLSNIRLVFVAKKPDASGLAAFDLPLVYFRNDKLNQPIFGCNHLSGECWPAVQGGGPAGTLPPHHFKVYFKEGGIGTFYPLYYALAQRARDVADHHQRQMQQQQAYAAELAAKAFVDPNDPTTVYLTQPVDESQRLKYAPKYAASFGQDEKYEDMGLRP